MMSASRDGIILRSAVIGTKYRELSAPSFYRLCRSIGRFPAAIAQILA